MDAPVLTQDAAVGVTLLLRSVLGARRVWLPEGERALYHVLSERDRERERARARARERERWRVSERESIRTAHARGGWVAGVGRE